MMHRGLRLVQLSLTLAISLMAADVRADDIPGWLESRWEPDMVLPSVSWWRDTTNQNALAEYYYGVYPQLPQVQTIMPGIYVVTGIGKSNVVALVGASEWVLVDCLESPAALQLALALLRPYTGTRTLTAVVYTSEDSTHISGSSVLASLSPQVYASSEFFNVSGNQARIAGVRFPRTLMMFGAFLAADPNGLIGPPTTVGKFPGLYPSNLVAQETTLNLAGFNITLMPDTTSSYAGLMVWLPDYKVLCAGDEWSPCFPDIGPLRGPARPAQEWIDTLDDMLALDGDYLIPTHGPVLMSNAEITNTLTHYRDAIESVLNSTLALMNLGYTAEDAAPRVQLPQPLADDPNLQQFVADIPSAVKGIYQHYIGWFNGEPPQLASSLTTTKQAEIMVQLAGGITPFLVAARETELAANDLESAEKAMFMAWAAYRTHPGSVLANKLYVQSLRKLAYMQRSGQLRNYYLSVAQTVEQGMPDGYGGVLIPVMVKNINPDGDSLPGDLVAVNGVLFFSAYSPESGLELWRSDGTENGTVWVKDINPGGDSRPANLTDVNGELFFCADDGAHGCELWKSDGTEAGTVMVKDINPTGDSGPDCLFSFNDTLFFGASSEGTSNYELWKSDGTEAGTVMLKDIAPNSFADINGTLFLAADDGVHGSELWTSDGTEAGTVMVKDINPTGGSSPAELTKFYDRLYFTAETDASGRELWRSNGTTAGTVLVRDINAGSAGSNPVWLTDVNGVLFFAATDSTGYQQLWKNIPTVGTFLVKSDLYDPAFLTHVDGTLLFAAAGGLYASDGTEAGTVIVKSIDRSGSSNPTDLTNLNGTLYFVADDGVYGRELWQSDGTENGTMMLMDIRPGGSSSPAHLTTVNDVLFFSTNDGVHGVELWKHDRGCAEHPSADLNEDGEVNFGDFAVMASQWLTDNKNP